MTTPRKKAISFRFRSDTKIGTGVAENDNLQDDTFLATSAYRGIADTANPVCVLVGKAGAGKSAIIKQIHLDNPANSVTLKPQSLAFHFLDGLELLDALRTTGVNLSLFYKLLWRHVFAVEILKLKYPEDARTGTGFVESIKSKLPFRRNDKKRDAALSYMATWGDDFFKSTEHRIQDVTNTLETKLKGSLNASGGWNQVFGISANAEGSRKISQQVKENRKIAQRVVSAIQVSHLDSVLEFLHDEVLSDRQETCFITIDDLDKPWVDSSLMNDLIAALLQEIFEFREMTGVKIVVALRDNILHRIEESRTPGFGVGQREKLASQHQRLIWNQRDLKKMLDLRVAQIVKHAYTKGTPTADDVLPKKGSRQQSGIDFILSRCTLRPRDLIIYFNMCIEKADGNPVINMTNIRQAETEYSRVRLGAVVDEWIENYPSLPAVIDLLNGRSARFSIEEWTEEDIMSVFIDPKAEICEWAQRTSDVYSKLFVRDEASALAYSRQKITEVLYK